MPGQRRVQRTRAGLGAPIRKKSGGRDMTKVYEVTLTYMSTPARACWTHDGPPHVGRSRWRRGDGRSTRCTPRCATSPTPGRRTGSGSRAGPSSSTATRPRPGSRASDSATRRTTRRTGSWWISPTPNRTSGARRPAVTARCRSGGPGASRSRWSVGSTCGGWAPTATGSSCRCATPRPARTTYGAGRYLLDTVKGADLGRDGDFLGARPQLRLQPVVRLRPRLGLPAGAGRQPARGRRPGRRAHPVID